MLARSFKTAADLGISEVERDALIKVLGMLERGEIAYRRPGHTRSGVKTNPTAFNMAAFYAEGDCGTIHCIAGWAEIIGDLEPYSLAANRLGNNELYDLFEARSGGQYGQHFGVKDITVAQAAHALSNYLTTGEPRWDLVLAE